MDKQTAIELLSYFVEVWELDQADESTLMVMTRRDVDAFKIAIESLEKQMPKKTTKSKGEID